MNKKIFVARYISKVGWRMWKSSHAQGECNDYRDHCAKIAVAICEDSSHPFTPLSVRVCARARSCVTEET